MYCIYINTSLYCEKEEVYSPVFFLIFVSLKY